MASGYMFGQYWLGDGIQASAPIVNDSYPQHQITVLYGGLFGLPFHLPDGWWVKVKFIYKVGRLIFSPGFQKALDAVKEVCITPDMNNGRAWGEIGQRMGKAPGVGENVYRHLLACEKWGPEVPYTRELRDTLLQLAYFFHKKPVKRG